MNRRSTTHNKALTASMDVPWSQLVSSSTQYNAEKMAHTTTARLEAEVAARVADMAIGELARKAGMPTHMFTEFLAYLAEKPDLIDGFVAYQAARRITRRD